MNGYQVIAKKFRPQTFAEIYEQDVVVQTLKNAISFQRIGQAYLFSGTRGTGKTTLARLFAKAINCDHLTPENEPCNRCTSCLETRSGSCLDVIEIDGASSRGIDDIRTLNETVPYAPSSRKYKVYIIDEVHMLTKEAFNALLKTLEEPPKHVIFFFATTEPHKIPPTILSRCQIFHLKRISIQKIQAKLSSITHSLNISIEEGALKLVAKQAQGSLRDAESLLDQLICFEKGPITTASATRALGLIQADLFFELDQAVSQYDLCKAFTLSEFFFKEGAHLPFVIESLAEHYRTILKIQMGAPPPSTEYDIASTIYSKHQLLDILDYLIESLEREQKATFKQLHLEVIFLHIIESAKKITLPSLVERLETLKQNLTSKETPFPQPIHSSQESTSFLHPKGPSVAVERLEGSKQDLTSKETTSPHLIDSSKEDPSSLDSKNAPFAPPITHTIQEKIKHEQIMRFASIEFNGNLKK